MAMYQILSLRFTHNDPFEDTESIWLAYTAPVAACFTHNDPFEDTERSRDLSPPDGTGVSPTTIRSRILKGQWLAGWVDRAVGVSPTTIRSRILKVISPRVCIDGRASISFTHNDPFEDTERPAVARRRGSPPGVSPTTIRSRILKAERQRALVHLDQSFTHNDPFEDTESKSRRFLTLP